LTAGKKLRFGILCAPGHLREWQSQCIQSLLGSDFCELAVVIAPAASHSAGETQAHHPRSNASSLGFRVYRKHVESRSAALRVADATKQLRSVSQISVPATLSKEACEIFPHREVERVRATDLDFILKFGFGRLSGEILQAARFGIWSFHPVDMADYRGVPTAFWEIRDGNPVSQALLLRLGETSSAGVVLYKGSFPTVTYSWQRNIDHILLGVAEWPLRVCRDILNGCAAYLSSESESIAAPVLTSPTNWETAKSILKMGAALIKTQMQSLLIREQWHVGIVKAPIASFLESTTEPTVQWLPDPPRTRFFSDPFAIKRGDEIVILFEDFEQLSFRGRISAVRSNDNGRTFSEAMPVSGSVFDASVHKAYPYLLEDQGEIYCVPETWEANEIALYRAVDFPLKWERVGPLLEGVGGVDATPFEHEGRWWMFYARRENGSNLKLYLASAPRLEGPWSPHPQNPIKTNIGSARPGGTPFAHNGTLYRPAQDSTHTYGGGIVIHRVVKLTATEYEEAPVRSLRPMGHGRYAAGFHTLAAAGDICVVDGKRFVAVPRVLPKMIAGKIASLLRAISPFKAN
jgi:hypothetical protein